MQRILIVRTSAIGDIVFAAPIAAAIKRAHPQAHVAWLVESGLEPLLAADPCVDQILSWPKREWLQLWRTRRYFALARAVRDFGRRLAAQDFDTALDLQGLLKSGLLTRLSAAPRRVGLGSREASGWLMTEVVAKDDDKARISSEYLLLARHLGLPVDDFVPQLHAVPDADARATGLLAQVGSHVVLAPFTTRPQKHWPEHAWRELIPRMQSELGLVPVILGGAADRDAAARICAGIEGGVLNLAGRTSLAEATALVGKAALVIGVDTGLTHAGVAFARPTVALFGSTCPYLDAVRANVRVIWLGLDCSPCRRNPSCDGAFDCLAAIGPERVMADAHAVLGNTTAATPHVPIRRAVPVSDPLHWSPSCRPLV